MACLLYVEYQVGPLALIVLCFIVVHYLERIHCPVYNCSNISIVSEVFPAVTRTQIRGDLNVRNLLAGTEGMFLTLSIKRPERIDKSILGLVLHTAQIILQISCRNWFELKKKII